MFRCKECGKEFKTETALKDHLRDAQVHRESSFQHKQPYGKWIAAIFILAVVCGVAFIGYRASTTQTTSISTGPHILTLTTGSQTLTLTAFSTSSVLLGPQDFHLTARPSCIFHNPPPYENFIEYNLYITNRYNYSLTYVNGSLTGTMTLSNGTTVPLPTQHIGPSAKGQWVIALPINGSMFTHGTYVSAKLELTITYSEMPTPIKFDLPLTYIPDNYPSCIAT